MIFGFDIHGVIDQKPEVFKEMFRILKFMGHSIYIITGPPVKHAEKELKRMNLDYDDFDEVFSVVDWLLDNVKREEMWQDESGNWWSSDENWWTTKAHICIENDISFHFDDSEQYLLGWRKLNCQTKFYLWKDNNLTEMLVAK